MRWPFDRSPAMLAAVELVRRSPRIMDCTEAVFGNPDGEALTEGLIADARVEPQHLIHFDDRDAQFVRSARDGDDHAAASSPGKSTPWQLGAARTRTSGLTMPAPRSIRV